IKMCVCVCVCVCVSSSSISRSCISSISSSISSVRSRVVVVVVVGVVVVLIVLVVVVVVVVVSTHQLLPLFFTLILHLLATPYLQHRRRNFLMRICRPLINRIFQYFGLTNLHRNLPWVTKKIVSSL